MKLSSRPVNYVFLLGGVMVLVFGIILLSAFWYNDTLLGLGIGMAVAGGGIAAFAIINLTTAPSETLQGSLDSQLYVKLNHPQMSSQL